MNTKSSFTARIARTTLALTVCLGASIFFVAACNGDDPVPQAIIDGLPPESGTPSAEHRPGQPCLQCHSTYGEALPELVIGGTIFKEDPVTPGKLLPAPGVRVDVFDSTGDDRVACTNAAGNFYIEKVDWDDITFPLKSFVGSAPRRMRSIIGREGSCGNCHKLPSADRPGTDVFGAGLDSPGVIIVGDGEEDQGMESCAVVP